MISKVLSKSDVVKKREETLTKLRTIKSQIDGIESKIDELNNQKQTLNVSEARTKSLLISLRKQILDTRKSLKKIDILLSKGTVTSKGEKLFLQE